MAPRQGRRLSQRRVLAWLGCTTIFVLVALILSILVLVAGSSGDVLPSYYFMTFETSNLRDQYAGNISGIANVQDWYYAFYRSVCYGNSSVTTCEAQTPGYTLSLESILNQQVGQPLPITNSNAFNGSIDTKAELVSLIVGIAFAGLSLIAIISSCVVIHIVGSGRKVAYTLWAACFTLFVAAVTLLASAGKITNQAMNMQGFMSQADQPEWYPVAMLGGPFYACIWVAAVFMCIAFIISITVVNKMPPTKR